MEPHHLTPPLLLPGPLLPYQEAAGAATSQSEVVPEEALPVLLGQGLSIFSQEIMILEPYLVEPVFQVSVVCSDFLPLLDLSDRPEVLGLQLGVADQLSRGKTGVIDSGEYSADSGLHAVGVVDTNYLGRHFQSQIETSLLSEDL